MESVGRQYVLLTITNGNFILAKESSSQRTVPMIMVNKETLASFDPVTKPSKGTNDHYYATVEVFHQLHCLDITRKFIWRNHYGHVDTFQDPPEMVWEHVGEFRECIP